MDISCRSWFFFWQYVSTPVVFKMNRSHGAWALLRKVKTNSLFSRWMFISDRDGIINLQVPTSHQVADIDDNRLMTLPWPFFSVLTIGTFPYALRAVAIPWPLDQDIFLLHSSMYCCTVRVVARCDHFGPPRSSIVLQKSIFFVRRTGTV